MAETPGEGAHQKGRHVAGRPAAERWGPIGSATAPGSWLLQVPALHTAIAAGPSKRLAVLQIFPEGLRSLLMAWKLSLRMEMTADLWTQQAER